MLKITPVRSAWLRAVEARINQIAAEGYSLIIARATVRHDAIAAGSTRYGSRRHPRSRRTLERGAILSA